MEPSLPTNKIDEDLELQTLELETALLAALLIAPDSISDVASFLDSDAFYSKKNRLLFQAFLILSLKHKPIDFITLADELKRQGWLEEIGGESEIINLLNSAPPQMDAQAYAREIAEASVRRQLLQQIPELEEIYAIATESDTSFIRLTLIGRGALKNGLSSDYIADTLLPYVQALDDIQHIMDEIRGRPGRDTLIYKIAQGSVSIDLSASVRETVELVLTYLVPWRRQNQRRLAELVVEEKELSVKKLELEVQQARQTLNKIEDDSNAIPLQRHGELIRLGGEARLLEAQAQRLQLENQKLQLEMVQMALAIVDSTGAEMSEDQRLQFAMRVSKPLHVIATAPLQILNVQSLSLGDEEE